MRTTTVLIAVAVLAVTGLAQAADSYSTDFETETIGLFPSDPGWYLAQWWNGGSGTVEGTVEAAPGGGQALCIVFPHDWDTYPNSNGEVGYTLDIGTTDGSTATVAFAYDMYLTNGATLIMAGDYNFDAGGVYMPDQAENANKMRIESHDLNDPPSLTDCPLDEWMHVETTFNAATDQWTTSVSYTSGSGGGTFSGTNAEDVTGEIFWGGWFFEYIADGWDPVVYENAWYIDNFSVSVTPIPEPSVFLLASLGLPALLALRRRGR